MDKEKDIQHIKIVITVDDSDLIRAKNNAAELLQVLKSISNTNGIG